MKKKLRITAVDLGMFFFVGAIGLTQLVHLTSMVLKYEFHRTALLLGIGLIGLVLLGAGLVFVHSRAKVGHGGPGLNSRTLSRPIWREHPVYCAVIAGIVLFQIIWNFYMHSPYVTGDITLETVQTILATDTVYQYNPLTGEAFTMGMPSRLKLLVLPVLYAAVAEWTGLPAQTVVCEWIPMVVLCLSYLVYAGWGKLLFPENRENQCRFLLFVAVLYQFGAYAPLSDGMRALQAGFTGESIRALVLLPYVLLSCVQKKWLQAVLGVLAEACIVWTLYGLGYSVLIILCVALIFAVTEKKILKRRGGQPS